MRSGNPLLIFEQWIIEGVSMWIALLIILGVVIVSLILENAQLKKELAASKAKQQALLIERDFWVEQGRNLQNSLQTSQRMYADLFDQLGRGVVTEESISDNLAMASEHLHQPLTSVEAIRGLTASMHESTQGEYSVRNIKGLMIDDSTPRGRR